MNTDGTPLTTYALRDEGKRDIYYTLKDTLRYEALVNMDWITGKAGPRRASRHEAEFIPSLLALYRMLKDKITYPRRKIYEELYNLEPYINEPNKLTLYEARRYLTLLRSLIEELGYTKFEQTTQSASHYGVGGYTK